ncbi:MAG TPA: MnhB domain-containing protein [Jatrophihabitans sp.]|nr:MnhB domain-containing protein [Jatrophihabitans sp.]
MAESAAGRSDLRWHRPLITGLLVGAVLGVLVTAAVGLPRAGRGLTAIARHAMEIALPKWGTTEPVNEIVYGSRGWDTFGETFLLLAAVMATVVLTRGREPRHEYVGESSAGLSEQRQADPAEGANPGETVAREAEKQEEEEAPAPDDTDSDPLGTPAPERAAAMTVVVRVVARAAAPILIVAGIYQAAWGYTPGGGFPAGVVLSGVVILLYAGLGHRAVRRVVRPSLLEPIEMFGAALLIAVGLVGLIRKHSFLDNWLPLAPQQTIRSGGTLQLNSLAELIEVATGITVAIFAMLSIKHEWAPDSDDNDDNDDPGSRT